MSDHLTFHTVDELRGLPTEALTALWELVPTDRQKSYKAAYDGEVRAAGAAGSDILERQLSGELLRRYLETALVPVGSRWARTPTRVQTAAKQDNGLESSGADAKQHPPSFKLVAIGGVVALIFVGLIAIRLLGSRSPAVVAHSATPPLTPTLRISPTSTPLALEEQDAIVQSGDADRAASYPVSLQISTGDKEAPRVWVVQRRTIRAAEWKFDDNPDTASFLSGMSVRPVIGIPYAPENAILFRQLQTGSTFMVTLNTGAVLTYEFATKRSVRRSETDIFRQIGPGLVLLLIGETDHDGLPTGTRILVTGSYSPDQELSRSGELIGAGLLPPTEPTIVPTATALPQRFAGVDIQIIAVTQSEGQITTRLRMYNGGTKSLHILQDDIWLALGYVPKPPGPRVPAQGILVFDLLPEQAVDLTLVWSWAGEPYASLGVGEYRFAIQIT
ncbi:MAG: hypothetical protein GC179_23505 [Anaerolineaceae bacterium]|nr:hypothetical protein [Anaerolineaceae bacterium]